MGKAVKKIAKAASKFAKSSVADPLGVSKFVSLSPVEDMLSGQSQDTMEKLAKTQIQIAQKQADQATNEANEQARASAMQIQAENDRNAATQAAQSTQTVDTSTPTVTTGDSGESATARRKRYNATSVGAGEGSNGPAIRI